MAQDKTFVAGRGKALQTDAEIAQHYNLQYPDGPQGQNLITLSRAAGKTGPVFEDAQRDRDLHQKRLNEMVEETLRQIHRTRLHMQQKAKHVRDTTSSYGAKFDHELACTSEELRRDCESRTDALEGMLDGLEGRIGELEGDLEEEIRFRKAEIEKTLGPIRDEVRRLTAALETERRQRRRSEEVREKMLADEVEDFTKLLDAEKHDREQQVMEFRLMSERDCQHLEKRQLQAETEATATAEAQRHELRNIAKERISCQHGVIENVASFVKKYKEQVARDMGD